MSGTSAPSLPAPAASPRSRPSMASASSSDAARPRVDRRFGQHRRKWRPSLSLVVFCRSHQRARAAAVQHLFPQGLPEPADPAGRSRTDRAKCRARRNLSPRSRDRRPAGRRARRDNPASRAQANRATVSADLAAARTGQRQRAAAATGSARTIRAGRSRLRSARRADDAGSGRHPEGDAGRVPAARSPRRRDRRPRGNRAVAGAYRGSAARRCRDDSRACCACASPSTTSPRSIR